MMTVVLNAEILSAEAGMRLIDKICGEYSTGTFEQKCVEKNKMRS